jgi:hypothetical protein
MLRIFFGGYRNFVTLVVALATLRYSTLLYATLRYSTLLYATLRYSTLLYATLRYSTLLYATLRYLRVWTNLSLNYLTLLLSLLLQYAYDTRYMISLWVPAWPFDPCRQGAKPCRPRGTTWAHGEGISSLASPESIYQSWNELRHGSGQRPDDWTHRSSWALVGTLCMKHRPAKKDKTFIEWALVAPWIFAGFSL